jgi:hypothetical protein
MKITIFGSCIVIILFFSPLPLTAQTAAEMDAVMESDAVTYEQAARFVLASAGDAVFPENVVSPDAFNQAKANGWLPASAAAGDPVLLGELSFLLMRAFDLKGGLMYTLLPGPRYAMRSLVNRSFIQAAADPSMTVPGERFLLILGNLIAFRGDA